MTETTTGQRPRGGRGRSLGYLLATVALLAAAGVLIALLVGGGQASRSAATPPPPTHGYGPAPTYALTDQNGRNVTSQSLLGKVQVVTYLFPYCTTYCPLIARTLAVTEQQAAEQGLGNAVEFVAFNVDPSGSGPGQMRAFLREYGVAPADPRWEFLTGSAAQVRHVVTDGFHVFYKRVSLAAEQRIAQRQRARGTFVKEPSESNRVAARAHVNYDIVHNDTVEVVSPAGQITALFPTAGRLTSQRLLRVIRQAAAR